MRIYFLFITLLFPLFIIPTTEVMAAPFVAGHEVAREDILRNIPHEYVDAARTNLHIAFQHTSHGTHVTRGMFGLQDYKAGDETLFGFKFTSGGLPTDYSGEVDDGRLDFHDYELNRYPYNNEIVSSPDLSANETAFLQITKNYLDAPENAEINVVMWSWCNIEGHDVAGTYLPGMQLLINDYGPGGSKILSGERTTPVTFIFMTGHANYNNNSGEGRAKNQADLITDYCNTHSYFCLDYYSIDTHDMEGNSWEDAGDDGNSPIGGNFNRQWQDDHLLGEHWFENRHLVSGLPAYGLHNTQHITANRKAYAMWWLLARIAGWEPDIIAQDIDEGREIQSIEEDGQEATSIENGGQETISIDDENLQITDDAQTNIGNDDNQQIEDVNESEDGGQETDSDNNNNSTTNNDVNTITGEDENPLIEDNANGETSTEEPDQETFSVNSEIITNTDDIETTDEEEENQSIENDQETPNSTEINNENLLNDGGGQDNIAPKSSILMLIRPLYSILPGLRR